MLNIAAYKFAPLSDLKPLRERLLAKCKGWGLKGTILLSTEGINLFVAGGAAEIDLLLAELRAIPGLETLPVKVSETISLGESGSVATTVPTAREFSGKLKDCGAMVAGRSRPE